MTVAIYLELSSITATAVSKKRGRHAIYVCVCVRIHTRARARASPFFFMQVFFSGVRSVRGLSITVKCAARDGSTGAGNGANWIAPYISIQQMKIDSDAVPLITARRIATVI